MAADAGPPGAQASAPQQVPWSNGLVAWLLRSPFHRMLSGSTMLLTFTGRKSRRTYTTPVEYVRQEGALLVSSRRDRRWWRNLRGGAPVTVLLRRRELAGQAEVSEDPGDVAAALRARRPRLSPEKAAAQAQGRVLVRIRLDAETG